MPNKHGGMNKKVFAGRDFIEFNLRLYKIISHSKTSTQRCSNRLLNVEMSHDKFNCLSSRGNNPMSILFLFY